MARDSLAAPVGRRDHRCGQRAGLGLRPGSPRKQSREKDGKIQDLLVSSGDLIHFNPHLCFQGAFRRTQPNMCKISASCSYVGHIPKGFL